MKINIAFWMLLSSIQMSFADGVPAGFSSRIDYEALSYVDLPNNYQETLTAPHGFAALGYGTAPYFAFKLTKSEQPRVIEIAAITRDNQIFYPIIMLINDAGMLDQEIKTPVEIKMKSASRHSFDQKVEVAPNISRMVITTDPAIVGKSIRFLENQSGTMPVYSGFTVIYVPISRAPISRELTLGARPLLEIMTPAQGDTVPVRKQLGFNFEFGIEFGGQSVADNPDGDNYRAGGGAAFGIGYSFQIPSTDFLLFKSVAGIRYQGGKGENQGVILQGDVVRQFRYVNLGAGLYFDLFNSVMDPSGAETNFKNAVGYQLLGEWRMTPFFNFGLKYVWIDYASKFGQAYEGDHLALALSAVF